MLINAVSACIETYLWQTCNLHCYTDHFLSVSSVEFYDELIKAESSVDAGGAGGEGERDDDSPPQMADFSVKALKLTGLTVELDSEHVQDIKPNQSLDGTYLHV